MDYINFIDGSDCSSQVGYVGGKQDISLQSNGCIYRSTIKHEIYHSLGYYHEQSRPDRADFVTINLANVKIIQGINMSYNFQWQQNTETFGVPYDGRSNMHYGYKAFSKNGLPTIEAKVNCLCINNFGHLKLWSCHLVFYICHSNLQQFQTDNLITIYYRTSMPST